MTEGQSVESPRPWSLWAVLGVFAALVIVGALAQVALQSPHRLVDAFHQRVRWDAGTQLLIARQGYRSEPGGSETIFFFPGFILLTRAVHVVVSDWAMAAVVAALGSGAAAVVAYWRWTDAAPSGADDEVARRVGLVMLLVYPFGFYIFGVPYGDVLFLALALAAFAAVERDRLGWAAVAGFLACLTRLSGFVLIAGLFVVTLERAGVVVRDGRRLRFHRELVRPRQLLVLLGAGGLVAFFAFCELKYHDAFAYLRIQSSITVNGSIGRPGSWPPLMFLRKLPDTWSDGPPVLAAAIAQLATLLVFVATLPSVVRRFGLGYGLYLIGLFGLIWFGSYNFNSAGRYLLAAFPAFAVLGSLLASRRWLVVPTVVALGSITLWLLLGFTGGEFYMTW